MSTNLADRAARLLGRHSRRTFLRRTAMAGTALAVAPTDFVLRPGTAYAAICNCSGSSCDCGALCCDGYTEFCCTMTGINWCPPGTIAAGWWKADGSAYCAGPRYYLDCNNVCVCGGGRICPDSCQTAPWGCGCAKGDCNNRKAGCTQFRYGQCNQQVASVGRIACRVVSCDPAVLVLGNCAPSVAVDNATANHNKPCLQDAPPAAATPSFEMDDEEEDTTMVMPCSRIMYKNALNTFWVDEQGVLWQTWDGGGGPHLVNLTNVLHLGPVIQERPVLGTTPDGDLMVGIRGADGIFNDLKYDAQTNAWGQYVWR